jgi:hypothetical protein
MRHVIGRGRMNRSLRMRTDSPFAPTGGLTLAVGTSKISVRRAGFLKTPESGDQE